MTIAFDATVVTTDGEPGIAMVGFADREFGTNRYLLFQRDLTSSAQDRKLGFDRIHIERDGQQNSTYGGIRELRLTNSSLTVRLEPSAAKIVSEGKEIEVRFSITSEKKEELARALQLLVADHATLVIETNGAS